MPSKYLWTFEGKKKVKAMGSRKRQVKERADAFLDSTLKEQLITKQDASIRDARIVELYTKWRGNFFYFKARFESKRPDAISPFFEEGFARLEYVGEDHFNLAYFRHTGKWWEVYREITLEQCLEKISDGQMFQP